MINMIRIIILLLLIFCTICAQAQVIKLVEVTREWTPKNIILKDGMVHKYTSPGDTAYYYQTGVDKYEITVTAKKIGGVPTDTTAQTVDANAFTGLWKKDVPNGFSWSNTLNQTLTYSFTGKAFKLIALKNPSYGIVSVQINNQTPLLIDLYASSQIKNVTILDTAQQGIALNFGTNTVTLKVTGQKNAAATNTYCVLDYALITK